MDGTLLNERVDVLKPWQVHFCTLPKGENVDEDADQIKPQQEEIEPSTTE